MTTSTAPAPPPDTAALLPLSTTLVSPAVPERIVQDTAAAYRALPPDRRDRTAVLGQSYIYAAFVDEYGGRYGLPPAYSGNRSYGYFTPPPEEQDCVLFLGSSGDELVPYFTDVRRVGDLGDDAGVWLATGRTGPWSQIWPRMRTLAVG